MLGMNIHLKRFVSILIAVVFSGQLLSTPGYAQAVTRGAASAVAADNTREGQAVVPCILRGLVVDPANPFRFDFIVDTGDAHLQGEALKSESLKLVRYFLTAVTVPKDQLWVNLSPVDKDRIIPDTLGLTEMGRDMLGQDYELKQLAANLTHPEKDLGEVFWAKVYQHAQELYGTTQVPVSILNRVWVVPDRAVVYETGAGAYIGERHLKVMLEEDYLARQKAEAGSPAAGPAKDEDVSAAIAREILLPEIEREVNEGPAFAQLRQIYNSMILAVWFKQRLKDSLLGQVYADRDKITGVDLADGSARDKVYDAYMESFRKGAYNLIREDTDPATGREIPRKYFSGGIQAPEITVVSAPTGARVTPEGTDNELVMQTVDLTASSPAGPMPRVMNAVEAELSTIIHTAAQLGFRTTGGIHSPLQIIRSKEGWGGADLESAQMMVDVTAGTKQNLMFLLPLNKSGAYGSPFGPISEMIMDTRWLSPKWVLEQFGGNAQVAAAAQAFIAENQATIQKLNSDRKGHPDEEIKLKEGFMKVVWDALGESGGREAVLGQVKAFLADMKTPELGNLEDDLLYMVLKAHFMAQEEARGIHWSRGRGWSFHTWVKTTAKGVVERSRFEEAGVAGVYDALVEKGLLKPATDGQTARYDQRKLAEVNEQLAALEGLTEWDRGHARAILQQSREAPFDLRDFDKARKAGALARWKNRFRNEIDFQAFMQMEFYRQLGMLGVHALAKKVFFGLDDPFGIPEARVWKDAGKFGVDPINGPQTTDGVAPETAYPGGQYWQLVHYIYTQGRFDETMRYRVARVRFLGRWIKSLLRNDHSLGSQHQYLYTVDSRQLLNVQRFGLLKKWQALAAVAQEKGTEAARNEAVAEGMKSLYQTVLALRGNVPEDLKPSLPDDAIPRTINADGTMMPNAMVRVRRAADDNAYLVAVGRIGNDMVIDLLGELRGDDGKLSPDTMQAIIHDPEGWSDPRYPEAKVLKLTKALAMNNGPMVVTGYVVDTQAKYTEEQRREMGSQHMPPWTPEIDVYQGVFANHQKMYSTRLTPDDEAGDNGWLYQYMFGGTPMRPTDLLQFGYFQPTPGDKVLVRFTEDLSPDTMMAFEMLGLNADVFMAEAKKFGLVQFGANLWGEIPFWGDKKNPFYAEHHTDQLLLFSSVHDSVTLATRWETELSNEVKETLLKSFGLWDRADASQRQRMLGEFTPEVQWAFLLKYNAASPGRISVIPWWDILRQKERLNIPGQQVDQWVNQMSVTVEDLLDAVNGRPEATQEARDAVDLLRSLAVAGKRTKETMDYKAEPGDVVFVSPEVGDTAIHPTREIGEPLTVIAVVEQEPEKVDLVLTDDQGGEQRIPLSEAPIDFDHSSNGIPDTITRWTVRLQPGFPGEYTFYVETTMPDRTLKVSKQGGFTVLPEGTDRYPLSPDYNNPATAQAVSSALAGSEDGTRNVGGIDLNPDQLNLLIKRDDSGLPLPLPQQPPATMMINGFTPVIINTVPVSSPFLISRNED